MSKQEVRIRRIFWNTSESASFKNLWLEINDKKLEFEMAW